MNYMHKKTPGKIFTIVSAAVISRAADYMCLLVSFFSFFSCISNFSVLMIFYYLCNERNNNASYYMKYMNGGIWKLPTGSCCDGQSHT